MGDVTPNFGAVSIVPKTGDGEKYRKFKIAACGGFHYALICRTYSLLSTSAPAHCSVPRSVSSPMEISMTSTVPLPASESGAYSPLVRAGPFIFLSGQLPVDPSSGLIAPEDIEAQTRQVIANIDRLLQSADASLADIVSVTAYLSEISHWDAFNRVYRSLMPSPFPTRTTVGVQLHGALVELTVVAYRPPRD